jgi:hypothetical protein
MQSWDPKSETLPPELARRDQHVTSDSLSHGFRFGGAGMGALEMKNKVMVELSPWRW